MHIGQAAWSTKLVLYVYLSYVYIIYGRIWYISLGPLLSTYVLIREAYNFLLPKCSYTNNIEGGFSSTEIMRGRDDFDHETWFRFSRALSTKMNISIRRSKNTKGRNLQVDRTHVNCKRSNFPPASSLVWSTHNLNFVFSRSSLLLHLKARKYFQEWWNIFY